MRSYSYVQMLVNGKVTKELSIWRDHNTFHIFEHDTNVFDGSHFGAVRFIEDWKSNNEELKSFLESSGYTVEYKQTIE